MARSRQLVGRQHATVSVGVLTVSTRASPHEDRLDERAIARRRA
jgi:hypothetical protein